MKKIDSITITKQRSYALILQAMLLFLLGGAIFSGVTNTNDFMSAGFSGIIVYILTIVVHELLHGLGFMLSGVRPKYGVAMAGVVPVAYATSEEKVSVPGMLMTAYLPFVALSVIFLIFARAYPQYQALAMIGFIANFTGAVGDLWIASKLWKYLPFGDVLVMDTKAGLKIYSDSPDAAARGAKA
ncbi:MAG: hypothetical protein QG623_579, partial [Patescibacteria group bacterium]|nr:hypothetical protein [Patescibacteria group bacterium]